MSDPLLPLLATIERLDREARSWLTEPAVYPYHWCHDARASVAPLASMLRVAVEALDKIEQPPALDEDGDTWCEYDEIDWMKSKARAALATIRRMAEEVERG